MKINYDLIASDIVRAVDGGIICYTLGGGTINVICSVLRNRFNLDFEKTREELEDALIDIVDIDGDEKDSDDVIWQATHQELCRLSGGAKGVLDVRAWSHSNANYRWRRANEIRSLTNALTTEDA